MTALPPTPAREGPQGSPQNRANPLLEAWTSRFETPPFGAIRPEHFRPAFDHAMADHIAEIEAIAACPDAPSFANTIVALERSGRALDRGRAVAKARICRGGNLKSFCA